MPATLTTAQLTAAFTAEQYAAVLDNPPPDKSSDEAMADETAAALARVDSYCAGWTVPAALLTGWARDITAWHVLKRLNLASAEQTAAKDRALIELAEVRDAKFPGITRAAGSGTVLCGGRTRVL